ncbi:YhfC family glutamic-type intramembrane protease [Sporomusa sp.]|uniref:YhfC family glutamic-type intramembrane protease n=1 Tax=Sporomusa sp. TaxID=2078658 RepID=UPI002CDF9BB5|nr:YhfC family glutamic-type intramembrane protease [Sporomusa sp.]HWR42916.1 YhfC family glutamic-type intramembrane protease [Sporomusa sp.]
MVLYSVSTKQTVWLIYAIAAHAAVDFPAALWQALHFNIFIVEALLLGVAAVSVIFIKRSRAMFESLDG